MVLDVNVKTAPLDGRDFSAAAGLRFADRFLSRGVPRRRRIADGQAGASVRVGRRGIARNAQLGNYARYGVGGRRRLARAAARFANATLLNAAGKP